MSNPILYSEKYTDDTYEYRHVILPKSVAQRLRRDHLMSEAEWRGIGVQMSRGWIHYMWHNPERHILLYRRLLPVAESPTPVSTPDQRPPTALNPPVRDPTQERPRDLLT